MMNELNRKVPRRICFSAKMVKKFQTRRSIVLTIAAATCIWLPYLFRKDNLSNFYSSSPHPTEFVAYIPSNFEEEWFAKREEYQKKPESACDDFKQRSEDIALWLSPQNSLAKEENVGALVRPERVMSKFLFRQTNKMYIRRIEPLVGQFRHPYALQACKPSRAKPVGIQDRSYISFVGLHDQYDLNSLFPGKKHLFDLGTAEFPTSLGFLVPKFASHGIVFDHIWAWEAKNMTHYWDLVPPELERKMHFYHHPVSSEVQSPAHPLQIIKAEVKPGDYVVRLLM